MTFKIDTTPQPPSPKAWALISFCQALEGRNPSLGPYSLRGAGDMVHASIGGWMINADLDAPPPSAAGQYRSNNHFRASVPGDAAVDADTLPQRSQLTLKLHWTPDGKAGLTVTTHIQSNSAGSWEWIPVLWPNAQGVVLVARDLSRIARIARGGELHIGHGMPITAEAVYQGAEEFFWLWRIIVPIRKPAIVNVTQGPV